MDFIEAILEINVCPLHYWTGGKADAPLKEATGNIRKAMRLWTQHDGVELVGIPNAKNAANLDQSELFHKHLVDFLLSLRNLSSNLHVHHMEKE